METVYLGLGSNMGNRQENIKKSLELLENNLIKILKCATIIETDPVGGPKQDKYLNTVAEAKTSLSPQDLLTQLHQIEKQLGRIRTIKNGPRPIDIDILLYGNINIQTPQLTIPHPRMLKRDFVMIPLKEISPKTVEALLHARH